MKLSRFLTAASAFALLMNFSGCSLFQRGGTGITEFTAYIDVTGTEIEPDNEIQKIIAEKTGVICHEKWKDPNKPENEAIEEMIIAHKYPDFIYGGTGQQALLQADALIPINEFWDEYENIKNYFTEEQWDQLKDEKGFIHYIPVYSNTYMKETDPEYSDEAFWIQAKVLEWAGYPKIKTLDEYFDLIESYLKDHPENEYGQKNIGYEILTDGYLFFCMENPPQFLDGYPNDGCCIVNEQTLTAVDYSVTPTAEKWFKKLNEEYAKGIIDPEFPFMSAAQYYQKIASGTVLGMADQHWNFRTAENLLPADSKYIPLDLVIEEGITPNYSSPRPFDISHGIGISVDCEDIEKALAFIDKLLSPEIMNLRFWGIEGQDYYKDKFGMFYRDEKQKSRSFSTEYEAKHFCRYSGFPYYSGMNLDGKNAYRPENQPDEYSSTLSGSVKRCLEAYGVSTTSELIHSKSENAPWYPMWSYTNTFTAETDYGRARQAMDQVKHRYLPEVIMSPDFETKWDEYLKAYRSCDTGVYFDELTAEIRRRAGK